ncbi:hypothetical protein Q4Y15_001723 [Campylobacter fetus]|uniref:Uncharacterized protein n=4 Tax=Campylobacter fetus TaxID=196 RepID=A0AAE6IXY5_CAMFE|nr:MULTISPECIES: hypothetical protein [Campylobacter]OCS21587.1 hypothetical protein CFVI97532_08895 [Campylobacter fetus subsp. venerealis cfvi97/532]OCS25414.1 hypothetical protein CFVB10_08640 [Campylobacter fetus subsp. venerealis cfvB10]OCS28979.1 hypothetical protein CFVCCUG33900_08805 [Campylobacter fetus subsp. venerealis LMG 6570 = CCUG 33900]OCS42025.1 hypothetical protein CFVI02298_06225 [Campylobacter fetus subsp. venerealis cfvi02/298]ABK82266.1 hypothetical protein CFF8240_0493 [
MEFKEFNINSPIIAHIKNLESQIKDKDKEIDDLKNRLEQIKNIPIIKFLIFIRNILKNLKK